MRTIKIVFAAIAILANLVAWLIFWAGLSSAETVMHEAGAGVMALVFGVLPYCFLRCLEILASHDQTTS